MDVHDTDSISRGIKLLPGMVITIEPGNNSFCNRYFTTINQCINIKIVNFMFVTKLVFVLT